MSKITFRRMFPLERQHYTKSSPMVERWNFAVQDVLLRIGQLPSSMSKETFGNARSALARMLGHFLTAIVASCSERTHAVGSSAQRCVNVSAAPSIAQAQDSSLKPTPSAVFPDALTISIKPTTSSFMLEW